MKKFLIAIVMLFVPSFLAAQQGYLEVTAPGNRLLQLAVASPQPLAGNPDSAVATELAGIFRFDMTLAGPFTVQESAVTAEYHGDSATGTISTAGVTVTTASRRVGSCTQSSFVR